MLTQRSTFLLLLLIVGLAGMMVGMVVPTPTTAQPFSTAAVEQLTRGAPCHSDHQDEGVGFLGSGGLHGLPAPFALFQAVTAVMLYRGLFSARRQYPHFRSPPPPTPPPVTIR